ncbi:MAG: M15 family metallopeptidase [Elusimicrobiota bacterium]
MTIKLVIVLLVSILLINIPVFGKTTAAKEKKDLSADIAYVHTGLVNIQAVDPSIKVQLVYSTTDNFLKSDAYGDLETAYLQKDAAVMLANAQRLLQKRMPGYSLIVYDAARPRSVQRVMWNLVKGTKVEDFVANPENGSVHNYGCAVDVTILDDKDKLLDMGTEFDFFGDLARTDIEDKLFAEAKLTRRQYDNRILLRQVMTKSGFQIIEEEWWHFDAFPRKVAKRKYKIIE